MLACSTCDRTYEAGPAEPWRCQCGAPLDFDERQIPPTRPSFDELDTRKGLWAFHEFLNGRSTVSLGEGFTPLVTSPEWEATFKLEYVSPSGSFKDRGATTVLSRAAAFGVDRVIEDSSGNAGAAIALYAARAGIDAEIFVPASIPDAKRRAIERTGARTVSVEGGRTAVSEACVERVETSDAYYASHAWNPAFTEGTMTFALEVCAQRDWHSPDAVVAPLGHGTLVLGAYRGFRTLEDAGWIDRLPRLLCAQAAGSAPIAARFHDDASGDNRLADGIQIAQPVRETAIVSAIKATNGDVIAVDEPTTRNALDRLHRTGFDVEPTSAVAPAAVERFRERGLLDPDDDIVVPLTGSGGNA